MANDGGDGISLREAIMASNNTAGSDTITFDASLSGQTIDLTSGRLDISAALTIDATALAANVTIDAQQNSGVLNFASAFGGGLTLRGLTITGGRTTGLGGAGVSFIGNSTLDARPEYR